MDATKLALKYLARRVLNLNDEIAELDRFIVPLVEELAPNLLELEGVGIANAGELMVAAGENPDRLRSEASFAMMCGACPIPVSSGKTQRHRLIQVLLARRGFEMSADRASRVWRQAQLQVPRRRLRRRIASGRPRPTPPSAANYVWAYDFVYDRCASGQQLKCLTVVDEWTRECLAIEVSGEHPLAARDRRPQPSHQHPRRAE